MDGITRAITTYVDVQKMSNFVIEMIVMDINRLTNRRHAGSTLAQWILASATEQGIPARIGS